MGSILRVGTRIKKWHPFCFINFFYEEKEDVAPHIWFFAPLLFLMPPIERSRREKEVFSLPLYYPSLHPAWRCSSPCCLLALFLRKREEEDKIQPLRSKIYKRASISMIQRLLISVDYVWILVEAGHLNGFNRTRRHPNLNVRWWIKQNRYKIRSPFDYLISDFIFLILISCTWTRSIGVKVNSIHACLN